MYFDVKYTVDGREKRVVESIFQSMGTTNLYFHDQPVMIYQTLNDAEKRTGRGIFSFWL